MPPYLNHPAYIRPNVGDDITLTDIFLFVSTSNPDYTIVKLVQDVGNSQHTIQHITFSELLHQAKNVAKDLEMRLAGNQVPVSPRKPGTPQVVVAMLGTNGYEYYVNVLACLLNRWTIFPISLKNSLAGMTHLLQTSKAAALLIDISSRELAEGLTKALPGLCIRQFSPSSVDVSSFVSNHSFVHLNKVETKLEQEVPVVYMHTSGSTGHPKIVAWTHRFICETCLAIQQNGPEYCGIPTFCVPPICHATGFIASPLSAFAECSPTIFISSSKPLSSSWFLEYAEGFKNSLIITPPSLIEGLYYLGDEAMRAVANNVHQVGFGGASLDKTIGNALTEKGLRLISIYGSTELGYAISVHEKPLEDWEYVQFRKGYNWSFLPVDGDPNLKELFVCVGKDTPAVINSENPKGFSTLDLWERHPGNPNLWKHHARKGNVLVLANGYKTDSKQLEHLLLEDHRIRFAQVFGEGRALNGVLLQPRDSAVDPEEFLNVLKSTIERANSLIPHHSRIIPELIIIAKPDRPFILTDKLTVKTMDTLQDYASEIEEAYKNLEEGIPTNNSGLQNEHPMNLEETKRFLRETITALIHKTPEDDADFFVHGLDSLLAIRLRSLIIPVLKSSHTTKTIPFNVIYTHSTINALAAFISTSEETDDKDIARDINRIINKYSSGLSRTPIGTASNQGGMVIVVTGTTGSLAYGTMLITLGCALLKDLLMRNDVSKIYALNRSGSKSQLERHFGAFREKDLDTGLLCDSRVVYVDVDISKPDLGIPVDQYEELRGSVTHILHSAWTLNFVYTLKSYEKVHIAGVRYLINLALSSPRETPPRITFLSSISAVEEYKISSHVPETPIDDPAIASKMGYGQSKYVAEQILVNAARTSGLPVTIIRIGQLSGYTTNGAWSLSEYVPITIRSSVELGMIPSDLPVKSKFIGFLEVFSDEGGSSDIASLAVIQQMIKSSNTVEYFHVENTAATAWKEMLEAVQAVTQFPLNVVSFESWLSHIVSQSDVVDHVKVPAVHLLDFYQTFKGRISVKLDTKRSVQICPEIAYGPLSKELLQKYASYQVKH